MKKSVLIVGAGHGLSSSLARLCTENNMSVALVARNIKKLENLAKDINATLHKCDTSEINEVSNLFKNLDQTIGTPDLVVYNPSARVRGPIEDLDPEDTLKALKVTCFGAFLVAQQATKRMLKRGNGSIFFTGASAGVKGFPNSSVFAMGKFGLRGLAQSLARELHPKNIHVGHFVIDGGIKSRTRQAIDDSLLDPDQIAKTYMELHLQHRSTWAWEIELRPWVEHF
jgi:short-subunit dehydrogenase